MRYCYIEAFEKHPPLKAIGYANYLANKYNSSINLIEFKFSLDTTPAYEASKGLKVSDKLWDIVKDNHLFEDELFFKREVEKWDKYRNLYCIIPYVLKQFLLESLKEYQGILVEDGYNNFEIVSDTDIEPIIENLLNEFHNLYFDMVKKYISELKVEYKKIQVIKPTKPTNHTQKDIYGNIFNLGDLVSFDMKMVCGITDSKIILSDGRKYAPDNLWIVNKANGENLNLGIYEGLR